MTRYYGRWSGNPRGTPEDAACCVVQVYRQEGRWHHFSQCQRKRGKGEDGLLCGFHAMRKERGTALDIPKSE